MTDLPETEKGEVLPLSIPSDDALFLPNYYEVLGVSRGASLAQIRSAYTQLKATFDGNSPALYSIMEGEGVKENRALIEEAYATLQNPQKRKMHDTHLNEPCDPSLGVALQESIKGPEGMTREMTGPSRIERWHMSANQTTQSELEKYHERIGFLRETTMRETKYGDARQTERSDLHTHRSASNTGKSQDEPHSPPELTITKPIVSITAKSASSEEAREKMAAIIAETPIVNGNLLRTLREAAGVTAEEMRDRTKMLIDRIYHFETDQFEHLAQTVYAKGSIVAYLRYLGVKDADKLAQAYIERMKDREQLVKK